MVTDEGEADGISVDGAEGLFEGEDAKGAGVGLMLGVADVGGSVVPSLGGLSLGAEDAEALGEDVLLGSTPAATGAADGETDGVLAGLDEGLVVERDAEGVPVGL